METLTVRENLMFSANLRVSNDMSTSKKQQLVENAIEELGLTACADQMVSVTPPLASTKSHHLVTQMPL
jgi:ATP-binding cassette, subfamily G (WHITE), member 2